MSLDFLILKTSSKYSVEFTETCTSLTLFPRLPILKGGRIQCIGDTGRRFAVWLLKWMDWHNLLPKAIIDASPMHNTMVFTNLASIRTNHIYHHAYDFGTTSLVMAAGNTREVPHRTRDGEIVHEKCLPLGLVMDERIASGYYFAQAFRRMKEYFRNPALLEEPPERILVDPEL